VSGEHKTTVQDTSDSLHSSVVLSSVHHKQGLLTERVKEVACKQGLVHNLLEAT
jgi:hypothetical protein